jgi:ADP-heptose:LPS heptosyltransferase
LKRQTTDNAVDLSMKKAIFMGLNALGDTLCTTPVVRAYRRANPDTFVLYVTQNAPYCRVLDGNPDIDLVLYNDRMLYRGLEDYSTEWLHSLPIDIRNTTNLYYFDLKQVCTSHEIFQSHISRAFSKLLNIPIECARPVLCLDHRERRAARHYVPRPYVVFSMSSNSNPDRTDGKGGRKKDWPPDRWLGLAERIHGWGTHDVIAVGAESENRTNTPFWRNLYGLPIKVLGALMESADCVVTIENGVAHLAAAVDAPTVQIYSDLMPIGWARPEGVSRWDCIYGDPHDVTVDAAEEAVRSTVEGGSP